MVELSCRSVTVAPPTATPVSTSTTRPAIVAGSGVLIRVGVGVAAGLGTTISIISGLASWPRSSCSHSVEMKRRFCWALGATDTVSATERVCDGAPPIETLSPMLLNVLGAPATVMPGGVRAASRAKETCPVLPNFTVRSWLSPGRSSTDTLPGSQAVRGRVALRDVGWWSEVFSCVVPPGGVAVGGGRGVLVLVAVGLGGVRVLVAVGVIRDRSLSIAVVDPTDSQR